MATSPTPTDGIAERIRAVRDLLRAEPGLTRGEIAARLPYRSITKLLRRMARDGLLSQRPRQHWTAKGGQPPAEHFVARPPQK